MQENKLMKCPVCENEPKNQQKCEICAKNLEIYNKSLWGKIWN